MPAANIGACAHASLHMLFVAHAARATHAGQEGWWNITTPRLDAFYGWLPQPPAGEASRAPLAYLTQPCLPVRDDKLKGGWSVLSRGRSAFLSAGLCGLALLFAAHQYHGRVLVNAVSTHPLLPSC